MDTVTNSTASLGRADLFKVGVRLLFVQGLLHPKGMQNLGVMSALSPATEKLSGEGGNMLLEKHLSFFNCNPNLAPLIVGGILKLEEQRIAGRPVTHEDIEHFKRSLSSPLAAMGDMLFLGGLKPLALTLLCLFAIYHSFIGLLAILVLYNAAVIACRLWGVHFGYAKGWELVDVFSGPVFQRLLGLVQSIGASVGGALAAVLIYRQPQGRPWMFVAGAALILGTVYLLRRDVSSSRFAIFLFPLTVLIALLLG